MEPEAREAAKIAARRAGMTLGQWLNQTIRTTAAEQLVTAPRTQQDGFSPGMAYRSQPPVPSSEAVFENLLNLTDRIERTEKKAAEVVAPLADQVQRLTGKMEQFTETVEQVKLQAIGSTVPVERAVQRLSERLERIEASRKAEYESRHRSIFGRGR